MAANIGRNRSQNQISTLEKYLSSRLELVEPRPELIARLQIRLASTTQDENNNQAEKPFNAWQILKYTLFGVAGIISSVILIISGARVLKGIRKEKERIQISQAA